MKNFIATALMAVGLTASMPPSAAQAQDPFVGQIAWFAGNFAPRGWAFCDGQLLAISQHQALFSLLGTTYGGDGRSTFALPDVRGRTPIQFGSGPGLSTYPLGARGGVEYVTVTANEMPSHRHTTQLKASTDVADGTSPGGASLGETTAELYAEDGDANVNMDSRSITLAAAGGTLPHQNLMPFGTLNCIIALQGIFPSRN